MDGVGIDDALVKNDFVSLGFFDCFHCFGVGISFDLVWIVHGGCASLRKSTHRGGIPLLSRQLAGGIPFS